MGLAVCAQEGRGEERYEMMAINTCTYTKGDIPNGATVTFAGGRSPCPARELATTETVYSTPGSSPVTTKSLWYAGNGPNDSSLRRGEPTRKTWYRSNRGCVLGSVGTFQSTKILVLVLGSARNRTGPGTLPVSSVCVCVCVGGGGGITSKLQVLKEVKLMLAFSLLHSLPLYMY